MSTIKVIHENTVRRFTISPNSTFSNLESQLRNLFSIPSSVPITVSYTDEDGDVITVSSDLELQEIVSQQSANRPIKLFLTTPTEYTHRIDNSEFAIVNKDIEEISESQLKPEPRPLSTYKHVGFADEEAEETLYESFNYEDNKEEPEKQESSDAAEPSVKEQEEKEKESNENDGDKPHVIFIRITRPQGYSHYYGPRFDLFGTLQFEPFYNFGLCQLPFGYKFDGYPNYRKCESKSRCSDKNSCGYTSSSGFNKSAERYRTGSCPQANSCGTRAGCQGFQGHCRFNQQLTSEQLTDKLKTLNSMGFISDNAKYEVLLKRYHGHIERVVEALLREQEESDRASSSKSEKQGSFEREEETSQSFVPVMEVDPENHPYSL